MLKSVVLAAFLTCGAISAYAQTTPSQPPSPAPTATPADRTVSTGDFNAKGDMAASALIGTKVRNANKESIGKIDDISLTKDALIALPDYTKTDRRKPAPPETATAPPARPAPPTQSR